MPAKACWIAPLVWLVAAQALAEAACVSPRPACFADAPSGCLERAAFGPAAPTEGCKEPLQRVRQCLADLVVACAPGYDLEGVAGEVWRTAEDISDPYVFRFLPSGVLDYDNRSGTWRTGRWISIDGYYVVSMNDGYAAHFGAIRCDRADGRAINIAGGRWNVDFVRDAASCGVG